MDVTHRHALPRRRSPATNSRVSSVSSENDCAQSLAHHANCSPLSPVLTQSPMDRIAQSPMDRIAQSPPRKRGRPRKNPISEVKKPVHARAKTGCATCRRRKKKCDERKPTCFACEKNNVFCDGYGPLLPWKSGKEKAFPSPLSSPASVPDLPQLVNGIVTDTDQFLLQHFVQSVSNVLSLVDYCNLFDEIILPMALSHQGLMHSILYLTSSCILSQREHTTQAREKWITQQDYHMSLSMRCLHNELVSANATCEPTQGDVLIAQTLILCLQTIASGDTNCAWRVHIGGLKQILVARKWVYKDERLHRFVKEFVVHHECCATITNASNSIDEASLMIANSMVRASDSSQTTPGVLIGVDDGLFRFIPRIRTLRDEIRKKQTVNGGQKYDNQTLQAAFAIDNDLRRWECPYARDSMRYTACLLHRQSVWLYLHRTIQPSRPSAVFHQAVEDGLRYLATLYDYGERSVQSVMLMPLFLLACAAFDKNQRPHITEALERLQSWSCMSNINHVKTIIAQIWHRIDSGKQEETWDWEALIAERDFDFIVT